MQQPEYFSYRKHSYVNDLEHLRTGKSTANTLNIIRECQSQSIKIFKNFKITLMTEWSFNSLVVTD